jgi:hypothetical protein
LIARERREVVKRVSLTRLESEKNDHDRSAVIIPDEMRTALLF